MENKTITPEWERYNEDMERWKEISEQKKPQRHHYQELEDYEAALRHWNFERAMNEPNRPGYFRANND